MKNVFDIEDLKKAFEAGQELDYIGMESETVDVNQIEHKYYSFEWWFNEWIKTV